MVSFSPSAPVSAALLYLAFICTFSVLSAESRRMNIPPIVWLLVELLGVLSTLLPLVLPSAILRFLGCVFSIMCFLSMHIRTCRHASPYLWKIHTGRLQSSSAGLFSLSDFKQCLFYSETLETTFYHAQSFVEDLERCFTWSSLSESAVHFLLTLFVGDGCILVLFELMPQRGMLLQEHVFFASLLVGLWLYCGLELSYVGHCLLLYAHDCRLNASYRHRAPIVSTTLSEFWGLRWNPVIMKLLQNSFYIPLRQRGAPAALCLVATFAGSAWLHGFPQFAHSFSALDAGHVALFFCSQGALVAAEQWALGGSTALHVPKRHGVEFVESSPERVDFVFYIVLSFFVWSYLYAPSTILYSSCASMCVLLLAVLRFHDSLKNLKLARPRRRTASVAVGWLWAVGCVFLTLPLIGLPYAKVLQTSYCRSFFAGPVLRFAALL